MDRKTAEFIISQFKGFSIFDDIYIKISLLSNDDKYDLERVRRKILKYKDLLVLDSQLTRTIPILEQKTLDFMEFDDKFEIKIFDGRIFFKTPHNESIASAFKSIRGRSWQPPYNTLPVENAIRGIKAVEKVFGVYIDLDIPEVCYGVVGVKPLDRMLKFLVLFPDESVKEFMLSLPMSYNSADSSYLCRVENEEHLRAAIAKILKMDGKIRLVHGSESKISELASIFAEESKKSKELASLSFSATPSESKVKWPTGVVPRPYQIVGVEFIEKTGAKTLIADEMGLGKTCQCALYLYNHPEALPSIVVCPSSVKIQWTRELFRFANIDPGDIAVINGVGKKEEHIVPHGKKIYVINYDILKDRVDELSTLHYNSIVLDEAHYIKNPKTKRTKAVFKLSVKIDRVICLTGTPIMNKPIELWNVIQVTKNGGNFGGFWNFAKKYCGAVQTKYGWDLSGATNLDDLHRKLREKLMIRRLKEQVLTDLPPKIRSIVPVEITNRQKYSRAMEDFKSWYLEKTMKEIKSAEALVKIEMLKQVICEGKKKELKSFIEDTLENNKKAIVFFTHNDFLFDIEYELNRGFTLLRITSDQSSEKRQEIIDDFNDRSECVLLCTIDTGGTGLNMQTATAVIFAELAWTPSQHRQAEDRAHRIGQRMTVNVYYVIASDTIEEKIMELIESKQSIIDEAVGEENVEIKDELFRWFGAL